MKKLVLILLPIALIGCQSNKYLIQYDSTPQSAIVTCGYQQKGFTPLVLTYTLEKDQRLLKTTPCKATWVSGAEAEYHNIIDTTQFPKSVRTFVQRPQMDGISSDIQFDYKKKQNDATAQAQTEANFLNSLQQNRSSTTYCNTIGFQTFCNTN